MSTQLKTDRAYTLEEYFDLEATSPSKHEYFDGAIFAMVGGSFNHDIIAGNLLSQLKIMLRETDCTIFGSDVRVHTQGGLYTYPDLSIVCGKIIRTDDPLDTLANPLILVEVLSKSTAKYDRGEKFEMYKSIPSLREYILIEQSHLQIEVWRRNEQDEWSKVAIWDALSDDLHLKSIMLRVPLSEIYRNVEF